jgi:glutathione S-transferase
MRLYWSSRSPFVRKVMIVAHELGIAGGIEAVRVAVSPEAAHAEVMRFNPLSKIPTLVLADGSVLHDSAVICEYLDVVHGKGSFFPKAGAARWRALSLQALADGIMETDILWMGERTREPNPRSADRIATCRAKIGGAADLLERDAESLAVDAITIGEVATFSALAHLDFRFPDERWRDGRPRLAQWFEVIGKRPSARATAFVDQQ